jgi:hypothetical protein
MMKKIFVVLGGIIGLIYILNPGAGIIELIPDNMPIVGNLDEAAAVLLILACLRQFGFDPTKLFSKKIIDD